MENGREIEKNVDSRVFSLGAILSDKYQVDYYQREYVWETKQIEDLINDLSEEFLRNWRPHHTVSNVKSYAPYFMGEIVLALPENEDEDFSIIDGQQRITTLTLILIFLCNRFKYVKQMPLDKINKLIYSDDYTTYRYNLNIPERIHCIESLHKNGSYEIKPNDSISIVNITERYADICDLWDERINETNIVHFSYWLINHVLFSKVWTSDKQFAYVIFQSMNDRGLSLTQVEMLRSYLLANVDKTRQSNCMKEFDNVIAKLSAIRLSSRSKATFEFFKVFFRGHYAVDLSQGNKDSDFVQIGKDFHRWVCDNKEKLGLTTDPSSYVEFIDRIVYFSKVYEKIYSIIAQRMSKEFFYVIVNEDYNFTLQSALILSAIQYMDSDKVVDEKIQIVSRHITKILSWRVWNQNTISQSSLESPIYQLCRDIREQSPEQIKKIFAASKIGYKELETGPVLNQQNRKKIRVLLALITEIVAYNSGESKYILDSSEPCEIEHILCDHYDRYTDMVSNENEFVNLRNNIGDLLVLTKPFNASFGDKPYEEKVELYYSQNILAQSLNRIKYKNSPGFLSFIDRNHLPFCPYDHFGKEEIAARANLYKQILLLNWRDD